MASSSETNDKHKNTRAKGRPNQAEMTRLAIENASWFYALYKHKKLQESLEMSIEETSTNGRKNDIIKEK